MNASLKVTLGILGAVALVGVGVFIGRTWPNTASEPAPGGNRMTGKTGPNAREAYQDAPRKSRYRATTTFLVNQSSAPDVFSNVSKDLRDSMSGNWLEAEFKSLTARKTLMLTVKNLKLDTAWKRSPADAASRLAKMIKAEDEPGTGVFTLTAWSGQPKDAVAIANGVRDTFGQLRAENVVAQQESAVEEARLEMIGLMKPHRISGLTPFPSIAQQPEAELPEVVGLPDPAEIEETTEAPSEADLIELVTERQKQSEYATAKNRYESQLLLLNTIRAHAERQAGETGSRNLVEILEPAVAVEDQ